jgi:hypothetical protein
MNKVYIGLIIGLFITACMLVFVGCNQKNGFIINVNILDKEILEEHFRYYVLTDKGKTEIIFEHENIKILAINKVAQNKSGTAAFSVSVSEGFLKVGFYVLIVSGKNVFSYKMPDSPCFEWLDERTLLVKFDNGKRRRIRCPFKN